MPLTKKTADDGCAKCERQIAELKKEVAALKKAPAGADPRVSKLIEAMKAAALGRFLEKVGLA